MSKISANTVRVTARVTPAVRKTIERAAAISGATLNQFLVQSALDRARQTIQDEQVISLSERDAKAFFAAVADPPKPSKKLRDAMQRWRHLGADAEG